MPGLRQSAQPLGSASIGNRSRRDDWDNWAVYTNKTLPLFTAGPAFQILTVRREQAIKIESIMRKLNMLVAFASVLTFVSSSTAAQSSIDGHWEGVMVRQGSELIVSFDFSDEAAGIRGSFNSHQIREVGARPPSWMPCLSGRPLRLLRPANDYVIRHPAGIRRRRSLACRERHRHATLRSREHAAAVRRLNGWGGRGAERMAGQSRPMQRSTMLSTNLY